MKMKSLVPKFQQNQPNNVLSQHEMSEKGQLSPQERFSHRRMEWAKTNAEVDVTLNEIVTTVSYLTDFSTTNNENVIQCNSLYLGKEINSGMSDDTGNITEVKSSEQLLNKPRELEKFENAGCSSSNNDNMKSTSHNKRKQADLDFLNEEMKAKRIFEFPEKDGSVLQTIASAVLHLVSNESVQKDIFLNNVVKKRSLVDEERMSCQEKIAVMTKELDDLNAKKMTDLEETNEYLLKLQSINKINACLAEEKIREVTEENKKLLSQCEVRLKTLKDDYTDSIRQKEKTIKELRHHIKILDHTLNEKSNRVEEISAELQFRENQLRKQAKEISEYKADLMRERKNHDRIKSFSQRILFDLLTEKGPQLPDASQAQITGEVFNIENTEPLAKEILDTLNSENSTGHSNKQNQDTLVTRIEQEYIDALKAVSSPDSTSVSSFSSSSRPSTSNFLITPKIEPLDSDST